MRRDVTFTSKGYRCFGQFDVPDGFAPGEKVPAIICVTGYSGVIPMGEEFAQRFVNAGFATLMFDFRYFGMSEGEPRSQLFPLEQVEDLRNAITWFSEQPEIDPKRIGLSGVSFGAAVSLFAATYDKRVKAVVARMPAAWTPDFRRVMDPEKWDRMDMFLLRDRLARYQNGAVNYFKVVSPVGEPCVLPGKEAYEEYMALSKDSPNWCNQVTIESLEKSREFDPVSMVHLMAPTALLLIAAEQDSLVPVEAVKAVYEKAQEPKKLSVLPITHFAFNNEPWLSTCANLAIDWFEKYL
jgi:dienelactone hydrolase